MFAKLLEWYDGYRFCPKKLVKVVNPDSLGNVLTNRVIDALEAPAVALLYQGGYLTIDESLDDLFVSLKIPNEEVRTSLYRGHMAAILGKDFEIDGFMRAADKTAKSLLAEGVGEKFLTFLRAGFSKLPHRSASRSANPISRHAMQC